jgi:zinc-ribbon domain
MALTKCKECGNDVAKNAATCPKCGTKLKAGFFKKVLLGIGGLFAFFVVVGMLGSRKDSPGGTAPAEAQGPVVGHSAPAEYRLGDNIELSDSDWVIVSAKNAGQTLKSGNQFQEDAKTDGYFVLVNFKVRNKKPKEERILEQPVLVDSKGREFRAYDHQMFYIGPNKKTMIMDALPSGMMREFWAIYEVPPDATLLKFAARELGFSADRRLVPLGI